MLTAAAAAVVAVVAGCWLHKHAPELMHVGLQRLNECLLLRNQLLQALDLLVMLLLLRSAVCGLRLQPGADGADIAGGAAVSRDDPALAAALPAGAWWA